MIINTVNFHKKLSSMEIFVNNCLTEPNNTVTSGATSTDTGLSLSFQLSVSLLSAAIKNMFYFVGEFYQQLGNFTCRIKGNSSIL